METHPLLSEEDKREQFTLFELANYCGLVLGIAGAAFIELMKLTFWPTSNTNIVSLNNSTLILPNASNTQSQGTILLYVIFVCIILYLFMKKKAHDAMGVSDSMMAVSAYKSQKDVFKVGEFFLEKYKSSSMHNDKSLAWKYLEKNNKQRFTGTKNKYEILLSHNNEKYNMLIRIEKENIRIIRPTTREAKNLREKLENLMDEIKGKKSIVESITHIGEYPSSEII